MSGWEKHYSWAKPGTTHEIKRSCNGWHTFSYTNDGEASSSNIFGADEWSRCQNLCNMKSCLCDCTPSDLTIGFSHALQTNSNTRLLPDIISQAMKCLKRVFSKQWLLSLSSISFSHYVQWRISRWMCCFWLRITSSLLQEQCCFILNQETCWTSCSWFPPV